MDRLKKVWAHVFRLQFWMILYIETLICGIALIYIDYLYDDSHLPRLLQSINFPYFGVIMVLIGIYSIVRLFKRIDLFSILANAAVWFYITMVCLIDTFNPEIGVQGVTIILLVLSAALSISILGNAYYLDLHKEKKISEEK